MGNKISTINDKAFYDAYDLLIQRKEELKKIVQIKENALKKAPNGKLHFIINKGRKQFYLRDNPTQKTGKYLNKKYSDLKRALAQKAYDEDVFNNAKEELKELEKISFAKEHYFNIQEAYSKRDEALKSLIVPIDMSDEDYVRWWQSIEYEKKTIGEDVPEFFTEKGERVRSKSEINIANALLRNGIPYKYEYPVKLSNGIVYHPDFAALQIRKRRVIFWEHRGMMDDKGYANDAVKKLKEYNANGIIVGDNLILSEETSSIPLGTEEIQRIINSVFLI